MSDANTTLIVDLNIRCPDCDFDIPPDQMFFVENQTLRCPKCGREWPEKHSSKTTPV